MPALNDSNIKSVCANIKTKGFTVKYWQDHRSSKAKGSGVGKAMKALVELGMDATGSPKGIMNADLKAAVSQYEGLASSFSVAQGKAKGATHTLQFIKTYIEVVKDRKAKTQKRLEEFEKMVEREKKRSLEGEAQLIKHDKAQLNAVLKSLNTMYSKLDEKRLYIAKSNRCFEQETQNLQTLLQTPGNPQAALIAGQAKDQFEKALKQINPKEAQTLLAGSRATAEKSGELLQQCKVLAETKKERDAVKNAILALSKLEKAVTKELTEAVAVYKAGVKILVEKKDQFRGEGG